MKLARHCGLWIWMLCVFAAIQPRLSGAPRIEAPTALWDLGTVTNSVLLHHEFVIHNSGDAALSIDRVVSGCDACLVAATPQSVIPPGGSSLIHCRLDLRRLRGEMERSVLVHSDDPARPVVELHIRGRVFPAFEWLPAQPVLEPESPQGSVSVLIHALAPLARPLGVLRVSSAHLVCSLAPSSSGDTTLTITRRAGLPFGRLEAEILLGTGIQGGPECLVTVLVNNPPPVEVSPQALHFSPSASRQTRLLWVSQHGPKPSRLVDVIVSDPKVRCEIEPIPPGFSYRIHVEFQGGGDSFGMEDALILKLVDEDQRATTVSVPLRMNSDRVVDSSPRMLTSKPLQHDN